MANSTCNKELQTHATVFRDNLLAGQPPLLSVGGGGPGRATARRRGGSLRGIGNRHCVFSPRHGRGRADEQRPQQGSNASSMQSSVKSGEDSSRQFKSGEWLRQPAQTGCKEGCGRAGRSRSVLMSPTHTTSQSHPETSSLRATLPTGATQ